MNVVLISPNFPPSYYHFCTALRDAGATVLGIGDAGFDELHPDLRGALTEYYRVSALTDYDAMLRACGYLTHRHGKIDRIESHTEFWLGMDARLREDFNVFGQKGADLAVNRHKMGMKRRFLEASIPCAPGTLATSEAAVRDFVGQHGYPVIFKPDQGVGAAGTFKVSGEQELNSALKGLPEGYMVEKTLTGDLLSFDGLTNRNGDIVFWTAHQFSGGIMETVSERRPLHYFSLRDIPETLERLGRRTVEAFGVRERFFHIEFFREAEDSFHALEINVRPPGGFTLDMMNYACDIDLFRWWADLVVGSRTDFSFERKYHVAHASRRDGAHYQLDHEALLAELGDLVVVHREIPHALSDAMGNYAYFLRSPDLASIRQAIARVEETSP
ncbi:MAG: acetyl-CoA carboxylase biotin carboxylase subunit family protein [Syntrophobacteraceae bacterium]